MSRISFSAFFEIAGIASYSIEGIGMLFALRFDYLRYNNYKQFRWTYFSVLVLTILVYFLFAIINYLKFYDGVASIIFYNYNATYKFLFGLQISYILVD